MFGDAGRLLLVVAVVAGSIVCFRAAVEDTGFGRADLVVANGPEPQSLDPAAATALPESRVLSCLFEGLVVPDPVTLVARPGMAETWERSPDGRGWTFHLREGLRWSDGRALTAEDLRWSFLRCLAPESGAEYAFLLWGIVGARAYTQDGGSRDAVGITVPGPRTLEFALERPLPYFLEIIGLFPFYPVPRHVVEEHGGAWVKAGNLVGNGAFRLVARRLRDRIRLAKNPRYWEAAAVSLETVDLLSVDSATTMLNLYMTGGADWITDVPRAAVPELLRRFGPDGTGEFIPSARLGTYYYRINTTRPPLTSPKVRRALALAIDRDAVVRDITRAGEVAARSFVPPGVKDYAPARVLGYDEEAARALFAEGLRDLGLDAPPPMEILFNTSAEHRAIAEVVQHRWRDLFGLEVRLSNQDWGSFQTALRTGDYTIARSSWFGDYNDASSFLDLYASGSANNQTGFSNPEYDELVTRRAVRESGPERAATLRTAEALLLEQAPIIPIYHYVSTSIVSPRVTGYGHNVMDLHPVKFIGVRDR